MVNNSVGFIGAGNMAQAIINGILKSGYIKPVNIYIFDIDWEKTKKLSTYSINVLNSSSEIVNQCKYVFLAVKPQTLSEVLVEIKDNITDDTCLVSIAAGKTIDYIAKTIGRDCKVIRIMPNTPLMYGFGASALTKNLLVADNEFSFIRGIFDSCGFTCEVDEGLMDTITAISGSSPAFVFRFAKDIINSGIENGLDEAAAKQMVAQTILGSAKMILESGLEIDELIRRVASPNGTTEAGLKSLDKDGFDDIVSDCIRATIKRSVELRE
ncbi:MAG TPA: pyrroline-5-carboxylate reductase [Clostridiales bacterium]|nr:pyrroline-5-carboxylate reductase [Clostridiales bacterium]